MNLLVKQKTDLQTQKTNLSLPKDKKGEGGLDWEFGISRRQLFYVEWINNKVLLYGTENHIQYPMKNHNRKEFQKQIVCVCIYIFIYI